MTRRDEFDDPEGFQSAFGKIAEAMEQGHGKLRRRGPLLGILTACVALFILFAVFWSSYPRGDKGDSAAPIPTIRADTTPYKTTPDNPGGMDIPYRDSTVFEALRNQKGDGKVESLLPAAEQPISKEKMFAGLKVDPIEKDVAAAPPPTVDEKTMVEPDETDADATLDSGPVKTSAGAEQAGSILPEKTTKAETPTAVAAEPKPAPKQGSYYIQLGSVKNRADADSEWKRLQKQFPDQLGDLSLRVQQASLGAKGTYYRIQGGAVAQSDAKQICAAITAKRPGGCIVIAR